MMGYSKKRKKKKRMMKHPKSIMKQDPCTCYLCERLSEDYREYRMLEEHHAFPGNPGRRISEENGFKVMLCHEHHRTGKEAVHGKDGYKNLLIIQQDVQREYEKTHTRQQWMELLGRNYL